LVDRRIERGTTFRRRRAVLSKGGAAGREEQCGRKREELFHRFLQENYNSSSEVTKAHGRSSKSQRKMLLVF
jgi:hypothetical protein